MRRVALALLALVALPAPASAWPEGRFASADAASEVALTRTERGGIDVFATSPALEATIDTVLTADAETGLLHQPERSDGWFARLLGSTPPALPFDGERLVFGREEGETLIVTTLEVDARGRPTVLRLAFDPDGDGLLLRVRRFDAEGVYAADPARLERVGP